MRRRLNMMNELVAARPRIVVMVSAGGEQPLTDFLVLWQQENFRCLVVLLSSSPYDAQRLDSWLIETAAPPAVDHVVGPLTEVTNRLVEQLSIDLPEDRLLVRIRDQEGAVADLDITECELIERPLLDGYELIQPNNLRLIQPDELSREDFEGFFTGSTTT